MSANFSKKCTMRVQKITKNALYECNFTPKSTVHTWLSAQIAYFVVVLIGE